MVDYLTFIEELKILRIGSQDTHEIDALIKKYEDRVKANEEVNNA